MGCTEPIAVALAAAKATETLKTEVPVLSEYEVDVEVSGNILKNGMGVGIPGTGMVGLYIASALGAVCGKSEYGLEVLKDLTGKVVAVQTGTSYLEQVKKVSGVKEVKNFPQDTDAQRALISKRVDAWVSDKFVAKEAAAKNAKAGFKLGDMLFIERIAPAMAKGNTGLADAWNKAFTEVLADGSYAAVSKKYFNEDVRCN